MKKHKILKVVSQGFILLSGLSFLSVSLMAFSDPQSVMDLVSVKLTNTDAYSSIRGVYGGVGLALCISLVYLMLKNVPLGLGFLTMIWGFYAFSRLMTIFTEGALGDFGMQWLQIEALFCLISALLLLASKTAVIHKIALT